MHTGWEVVLEVREGNCPHWECIGCLYILDLKRIFVKQFPLHLKSIQPCTPRQKFNSSDPDLFALNSSQCCFEEADVQKAFSSASPRALLFKGKKSENKYQGQQKKKKSSLKPGLTTDKGGLQFTVLAPPCVGREDGPASAARLPGRSRWKPSPCTDEPHCTLRSWNVCLLQPINSPNDVLNKARILSLVFAFLFMLFFSGKRSKQWGHFFSTQSGRSSLKWMWFFSLSFLRKNLYNQRLTIDFLKLVP